VAKLGELEDKGAKIIELDVTAPLSELHQVAKQAIDLYGRVDVVVNNAGELLYTCHGAGNRIPGCSGSLTSDSLNRIHPYRRN